MKIKTGSKNTIVSMGLEYKKLDLHIHTPASKDHKEKTITPKKIVDAALSKGLAGIAITDHQTGKWIDKVKRAASNKLVVFPGVEILATGGKKGVHIIALFDADKDSNHVNQFLHKLEIYHAEGKVSLATEFTVGQIADELEKYDSNAVLILAHCHSSKGVTGDIEGETRKLIFSSERKCLLGAEANETNFLDKDKIKKRKRVVDCFDGTDPNYGKRKLGVFQGSDAHSLSEIGRSFSYFKVDSPITIEDIRQCLIDRDTRIRQSFEYKRGLYPYIRRLKITSGFLVGQELEFHEGLNSLLGGKGAGKSLAIEFMRFALDQPSTNNEIREDHNSKLEKCLKYHGEVELTISDDSGKEYLVRRVYNPSEDNPIEIIDTSDNSKKGFEIGKLFPVLFLSQNEIVKIAGDKSNRSQRQFIDGFFDFHRYQGKISDLNKKLSELDAKVADSLRSYLRVVRLNKSIKTYIEEIEKLGRQIENKVFEKYSKQEKIGRAIMSQIGFLDRLRENLEVTESEYKDLTSPSAEKPIDSDPAVKRASEIVESVIDSVLEKIQLSFKFLKEKRAELEEEYQGWKETFVDVKEEYDGIVKKTGGNQVLLDQRRKKLLGELTELEENLAVYETKSQLLEERLKRREEVVGKLEEAYGEYFKERRLRCRRFTKNSDGVLQVTIKEKMDTATFCENLLSLKRGSYLKDEEVKVVAEKIPPKDFVDLIINYELSERKKKKAITAFAKKLGIEASSLEKLIQYLLDNNDYEDIFGILYNSVPEDIPSIRYKVGSKFKPLEELSVGQKAVALLIIALSDGVFPIVIDQPEDSLDLRTIWDDVCLKLRKAKEKRQFIFTTHNSSVAVASDSDKFVILQAGATRAKVLHSGSINQSSVKEEVISYLEGGKPTYYQKKRKYNL